MLKSFDNAEEKPVFIFLKFCVKKFAKIFIAFLPRCPHYFAVENPSPKCGIFTL